MDYRVQSLVSGFILASKKIIKVLRGFFRALAGCVLNLVMNYSKGPVLALKTKRYALIGATVVSFVLVCSEGRESWRLARPSVWRRNSGVARALPCCDPRQLAHL